MGTVTEDDRDSRIEQRYASGKGSYDPRALAGQEQEQARYDREFQDITKNSNLGDLEDATTRPSLYNPSSYGGDKTPRGRKLSHENVRAILKKRGVLGLIGVVFAVVGIGGVTLLSPSLLLFQISDTLMNNFNDGHAAITVTSNRAVARKIANTFSDDATKCGIRCKFNTMSKPLVAKLEAQQFKIEKTDLGGGRFKVTSIEWPGGEPKITSKAEFEAAMKNPTHAAKFTRAYNVSAKSLLATRFKTALRMKLPGVDKAFKLADESREKFKESYRRALGLPATAPTVDPNNPRTNEERVNDSPRLSETKKTLTTASGKVSKLSNLVGAACTAYNVSRATTAAYNVQQMATYASVAMMFMNAAHKTKADGIDPLISSELGNRLTSYDPVKTTASGQPNPLYGLSAMDSYGYKAAVYGDKSAMPTYAQKHRLGGQGIMSVFSNFVSFGAKDAATRSSAELMCKGSSSPLASAIQCGPAWANPLAGVACTFGNMAVGAVIGGLISAALPQVIDWIVQANLDTIDENTIGAELGDVLYPGAALIFAANASSYGMKAGKSSEIKQYTKLSANIQEQDTAIARINAKEQPLDISNKYSFLGSMAATMNLSSLAGQPITSVASTTASLLPRSLASLTSTTHAGTYQPLPANKAELYSDTSSECQSLAEIGVASDDYCMPSYVVSNDELNASSDANLDYMITNGYIDETTGAAQTTDQGKIFQKYLDNCPFRTDPLGETSKSLEDGEPGDYEWYIGGKCSSDDDMIKQFRIYTMNDSVNALVNGEEASTKSSIQLTDTTNSGAGTTSANSGSVNPNGWAFPTTAGATITSPFGPRDGAFHTGVDLGVPSGSAFYATRDGVVQTREFNVNTYNGGNWCSPYVKAQMTDPNQKDIWITHTVDGVTYTSIYAHMSQFLKQTGDVVKAGDLIGYTGGSGCSTGPHVHFEIWKGNPTPGVEGPGMLDPWPLISP